MIVQLPAWFALGFLTLVAVMYTAFVMALQYGNQEAKKTNDGPSLLPFQARLSSLMLLFCVSGLALSGWLGDGREPTWRLWLPAGCAAIWLMSLVVRKDLYRLAEWIPLTWILAIHSFRSLSEFYLHLLSGYHIVPETLTWSGQNGDIMIGVTGPILAGVYYVFGYRARWSLLGWHLASGASLINASRLFWITVGPGEINRAATLFPYIWLPTFLWPLAMILTIVGARKVWLRES